ncbi:MAG: Fur family transcriptional regulator [Xanthomonadales bacterium]|nr:Fur family transcriptional regulator [Xanthomonadales bacterium]
MSRPQHAIIDVVPNCRNSDAAKPHGVKIGETHLRGIQGLNKSPTTEPPLPVKWRKLAETCSHAAGERLTPARLAAYAELLATERPVSAYELIALLEDRQQRKIAPLTVYRHLDFLTRVGLVHRLESTQSYLPCDHPEHAHESQYLLCSSCGQADEVESKPLESLVRKIAGERGFQPENTVVEIKGLCAKCSAGKSG